MFGDKSIYVTRAGVTFDYILKGKMAKVSDNFTLDTVITSVLLGVQRD